MNMRQQSNLPIRRRNHRRHAAVHEAGHAVVGRVLGLDSGAVTIEVNRREMEAGHAVILDPMFTLARWDRIGRFRGEIDRSAYRARIMANMAGAEAEIALLGTCGGGDGADRREIAAMLDGMDGDVERQEARLRQATRQVVRRHVGKIERLARALAAYDTLADDDVIRAVAGLPAAPPEVDWWAAQFADAEMVEVVKIRAPASTSS